MRRIGGILLLVCLLVTTLFAATAYASAEDEYGYIKGTGAVLYSDSAMTKKVKNLSRYEIVLIKSKSSTAAQVKLNGADGYVAAREIASVTNLGRTAKVNKAAKIYVAPSTSSKKASVSKGTAVNLIAYSGSWAMVERNGVFAYILKSNLTETAAPAATRTPAPSATPAPAKRSETLLTGNVTECSFTAKVNVKTLSFYSRPKASSSYRISYLYSGNEVTVLAYNSSWAYVEYKGKTGYCQKSYLKKAAATVSPKKDEIISCTPFTAVANQAKVNVYEQPDAASKYLGYIVKGVGVEILGYGDTWAYISLGSRKGYACKSNFALPAATPAASPAPTPVPSKPVYVSSDEIFTDKTTTNEQKVYLYLSQETDYNSAVACGIMASINQESHFNPESGKGKSYQGLCQWSSSRFSILENWCKNSGYDPYSLEGQIKFLYYDLSQRYTVYHKALLAIGNTAEGAYEAGYYFCYHYERPASLESSSEKRGTAARDTYWAKYGD